MTKEEFMLGSDTESFLFSDFEEALVGYDTSRRAIYDYNKMIQVLKNRDGMTEEEAISWIDYNTIRTAEYLEGKAPIILVPFEE